MKPKTYFDKYKVIYGISRKFAFNRWDGYVVVFSDWDEAQQWLHKEEYDFRTRELVSKTKAIAFDKTTI